MIQFAAAVTEQKHQTAEVTSPVPYIMNMMVDAVLQALSIVFIAAVAFMHIENWSSDREPKLELFQSVYFIVTTMTTVGYGDIFPTSPLAQAFTCALMFYLLLVLFPLISEATDEFSRVTAYNSAPACYNDQPVILWQAGGQIEVDKLVKICSELFVSDQAQKVSICIVCNEPPSEDMEAYLNLARTDTLVWIEGDLMSNEVAGRAGVQYAKACILMAPEDCSEEDMLTTDEAICIMGMRVRQYVSDECITHDYYGQEPLRVILSLNKAYNTVYFTSGYYGALPNDKTCKTHNGEPDGRKIQYVDASTAISIREFQMQALAKSTMCPGFAPFIANIASMRGEFIEGLSKKEARQKFRDGSYSCKKNWKQGKSSEEQRGPDPWLEEYFSGAEHEIYTIVFDKTYDISGN